MKKLLLLLAVVAAVSIAAVPVNPSNDEAAVDFPENEANIVGTWKTIDDETGEAKSHVKIYLAKNGKYYGQVVKLLNRTKGDENPACVACAKSDARYNQKIIGMKILMDLEKSGATYGGGTILDPKTGKIYSCKVWAEGNEKLMVRGYLGPFYRTQTWQRIN